MSSDWKNGNIVCIPKRGKLSNWDKWRRVTLLSTPGKMYWQMILNCMHDMPDTQLCEEQVGFRPKQPCEEQIFILQHIMEKCEYQVPQTVSFIDFSKPFDSIHRLILWGSLHHMESQLSWSLPLRRFTTSQAAAFKDKMDTAASFKFLLVYYRSASSPLYCLLSQLTGYFGLQLRTEVSPGFRTAVFLTLTLQLTLQLSQTTPMTFKTWLTHHTWMPSLSINAKKTKNMLTRGF